MKKLCALLTVMMLYIPTAKSLEASAELSFETRQFFSSGESRKEDGQYSIAFKPSLFWASEEGGHTLVWTSMFRADSLDRNRSHIDLREAYYQNTFDFDNAEMTLKVGAAQVFWGVTETQNIVDVINQSDRVDAVFDEKLGQPMINTNFDTELGYFEFYLMPYFRERTFASEDGRLGLPGLKTDALYQSSRGARELDTAFRYSYSFDTWDVGLSYFHGTNRQPFFAAQVSLSDEFPPQIPLRPDLALLPFYAEMEQVGLELQAFSGDWTWKLEAIYRDSIIHHTAVTAGFEYPFVGIAGGDSEAIMFVEYLYDTRKPMGPVDVVLDDNTRLILQIADTFFGAPIPIDTSGQDRKLSPTFAQNDISTGFRWALNDLNGTEIRAGVIVDLDNPSSNVITLEASSRINEDFKWEVSSLIFNTDNEEDLISPLKDEDYIQLLLTYYF
ncbi:DUF1302 family protein [Veronia pacifica]|uniref:Uncharacterized protein n=1 Tax=Veronia pacifica TaxID=1080227 RepID=A0A1C3ERS7_9GAMM|nr:DUF1302 family protein [Veronia pacifica]ODA35940.1 hypothetical protein A8L45_02615 [Veronia pacifica]